MLGVENADANVVSDTGLKALVVDGGMDWVFELMRDPLAMTIIWPLLASAVGAGLARLFAGPGMGAALAPVAITIGFLLGYLVILGLPGFPPPSSTQKLPYLVVLVAILAVVVALVRGRLIVASAGLAVLAIGGLLWLSGRRLGGGDILSVALALGPLWLGWLVILFRLARLRNQGQAPAVMVLVAALGLAGIGIFGASASVGQMALALAAAVGGYLLWNWPRVRFPFGETGLVAAGGSLLLLASYLILAWPRAYIFVAVAVLVLVFFADGPAGRLMPRGEGARAVLAPVILGVTALLPVAVAVAITYVMGGGAPY